MSVSMVPDVGHIQFLILKATARSETGKFSDIQGQTRLGKPVLCRSLAKLVERGLVKKEKWGIYALTKSGEQQIAKTLEFYRACMEDCDMT